MTQELGTGRHPRRRFVAAAAVGVGALLGTGGRSLGEVALGARPTHAGDEAIFRFALQLETLQARFYADAVDRGALRGELREFAEVVGEHEKLHVEAVAEAAGRPVPTTQFDFRGATATPSAFAKAASLLEELGVGAYNGVLANLTPSSISLAMRIVSVEGRHAAWIRDLVGMPPAPRPADPGEGATAVSAELARLGFRRK